MVARARKARPRRSPDLDLLRMRGQVLLQTGMHCSQMRTVRASEVRSCSGDCVCMFKLDGMGDVVRCFIVSHHITAARTAQKFFCAMNATQSAASAAENHMHAHHVTSRSAILPLFFTLYRRLGSACVVTHVRITITVKLNEGFEWLAVSRCAAIALTYKTLASAMAAQKSPASTTTASIQTACSIAIAAPGATSASLIES
jgi:hypothetical protein